MFYDEDQRVTGFLEIAILSNAFPLAPRFVWNSRAEVEHC